MSIHLSRQLYDEMVSHSMRSLPNEACGILTQEASLTPSDELQIHTFIPLHNYAADPTQQFAILPSDILPYLIDKRRRIVGIFHSHPTAASIPSAEDLSTLWHTIPTYWILSLQHKERPNLQVYSLKKTTTTAYHKLSFVIGQ
ncbi:Mov34/MPN/PAD-1 family protein [Paenibacillus qinlingensis]|uniref:Mov34/MPN/PAD-1 family protein n=1 Tax=Paenibacillus qinlingensis TaxID=1837343 RepID=UPI00156671F5|nr:Mov34/MPN/PAD-1 family protein [Paenibacillus qinlingensis]NQX61539.1 Mov34/MPN/PAD-1 family protein [Paenibacillus qinlingensis]